MTALRKDIHTLLELQQHNQQKQLEVEALLSPPRNDDDDHYSCVHYVKGENSVIPCDGDDTNFAEGVKIQYIIQYKIHLRYEVL